MDDQRVRKPQPIHLPPAELDQGPEHKWRSDQQDPPVTRSNMIRWALIGGVVTIVTTVMVSLFVALTDANARTPVLTALIGAVFGLPATLATVWALYEKNRNRSTSRGNPRRKK